MADIKSAIPKQKEKDVLRAIGDYLTANRVFWFRNNTGAFAGSYKGKARFFRYGVTGSGDIFALHRGIFYTLECKAPGKVPTSDQNGWMERVRHNQGRAAWFDNVDEFIVYWESHCDSPWGEGDK